MRSVAIWRSSKIAWGAAGAGRNPQVVLQSEEFAQLHVALGGGFVFDQQAGAQPALRRDQFVVGRNFVGDVGGLTMRSMRIISWI